MLVPTDTWFPKAALGYTVLHRLARKLNWPSHAGLLPKKVSAPLVWTVLWIQLVPGEDICPWEQSSMSDLGQVGRPQF